MQHNHLFGILDCKPIFLKTSFLKVAFLLIDLLEKELFECLLIETWGNALDRRALRKALKKRRSKRFLTGRVIRTPVRVSRSWTDPAARISELENVR